MNCLKIGLVITAMLMSIFGIALAGKEAGSDKISWVKYEDGLIQAKAEDKPVFIDFSTSWCYWCKKMDKDTFSQKQVIDMVNQHFVAIKVDGDSRREMDVDGYKITERDLTKKEFGVRGYPAFWFLDSDGEKLGQISGYRDAAFMMQAFEYIKEKKYDTTSSGDGNSQEGK